MDLGAYGFHVDDDDEAGWGVVVDERLQQHQPELYAGDEVVEGVVELAEAEIGDRSAAGGANGKDREVSGECESLV